jgi:D-alanyl-D-alanine carboxypeptidase
MVIRESFNLDDKITFNGKYSVLENSFGVVKGDKMTVRDALKIMLIPSKNDIPHEMADAYPGGRDAFIRRMNALAVELGMANSHFSTPSGLWEDSDNYSTAFDLRLLVDRLLNDTVVMGIVGKRTDTVKIYHANGNIETRSLWTTNLLLGSVGGAKGLKTGYTKLAGQCLVGYFDFGGVGGSGGTNNVDNSRLITIVLNSVDRFGVTKKLIR